MFAQVFAYIRFSSDAQIDGDSFARQRASVQRFCSSHHVPFESVQFIEDPGLSAFAGDHLKKGELGAFFKRVKADEFTRSLFLVESVSRLSRQGPFVAFPLVSTLLDHGFHVAFIEDQIPPFNKENTPPQVSILLSVLSSMAKGESDAKALYARANWSKRRKLSAENPGSFVFTRECPLWLKIENNRYQIVEEKAESVRTIHQLYSQGWGISKLVRHANSSRLPVPGKGDNWHFSLIKRCLDNAAVIGQFQPHERIKGQRVPSGPAIDGFYPSVVPLDLWHKVRKLRQLSPDFPGRRSNNNFNFLQGLAKCSCGGAWRRMNKNSQAQNNYSLYSCSNRQRAFTNCANINGQVFDTFFINRVFKEIPLFLKDQQNPELARLTTLQAELKEVQAKKSRLLNLLQADQSSVQDVAPLLALRRSEETTIQADIDKLAKLEVSPTLKPLPDLHLFLFAFTYFPDPDQNPEFYELAYRVRSYFRVRLLELIHLITIDENRQSLTIQFKNGQTLVHSIKTFTLDVNKLTNPSDAFQRLKTIEQFT